MTEDKQRELGGQIQSDVANTIGSLTIKNIELSRTLEAVTAKLREVEERNEALEALTASDDGQDDD